LKTFETGFIFFYVRLKKVFWFWEFKNVFVFVKVKINSCESWYFRFGYFVELSFFTPDSVNFVLGDLLPPDLPPSPEQEVTYDLLGHHHVAPPSPEPDVTYDLLGHHVAPPHRKQLGHPPPCSVDDLLLRHSPDLPLLDLELQVGYCLRWRDEWISL
jgi:hypothetical protein